MFFSSVEAHPIDATPFMYLFSAFLHRPGDLCIIHLRSKLLEDVEKVSKYLCIPPVDAAESVTSAKKAFRKQGPSAVP